MLSCRLVISLRDQDHLNTALVTALAEKLTRLAVKPGVREVGDAFVDLTDEERAPHDLFTRDHRRPPSSREADPERWYPAEKTYDKNNAIEKTRHKSFDTFSFYVKRARPGEALALRHQPHAGAPLHRA